jgi:myo-inositol-1(or 4)-monophosphatase
MTEAIPPEFWTAIVQFAETTTQTVGTQILKEFVHVQATEKADGSLVTRADQWADAELRQAIAQAFPDHGVLSEEVEHILPDNDWCWVIDPIDGTTNFARGIPLWAISLGLLYKGTPVFGHVYLPTLQHAFHGFWPGDSGLTCPTGAFLNHQPIRVTLDSPSPTQFFSLCARSAEALKRPGFPCKVRILGVASYNLLIVAAGYAIGAVEATPKIWDIAAVWAIVQAAGGVWVPLTQTPIFPLQRGSNYGQRSYPTLVVSQPQWVPLFSPYLEFLQHSENSSEDSRADGAKTVQSESG